MFYGITDLTTFVLGTVFIILVPGPNSLYVLSVASRFGIAPGLRGLLGVASGDIVLMLLTATGMASVIKTLPFFLPALQYAGAAYLVFLGISLLRAGIERWRAAHRDSAGTLEPLPAAEAPPPSARHPYRTALMNSQLNPKGLLFYFSFFIQFVSPDYAHPELSFAILGGIVLLCGSLYLGVLVFAGHWLASLFRRRRKLSAVATGGVGGLFIGFGARLASAGLN